MFADAGLPNAEEHFVKAQLVYKIDTVMKERGLKQVEAAKLFGVKQPDVSKMLRGEFRQFPVERLLRFLVPLGQDVEITVKPPRDKRRTPVLQVISKRAMTPIRSNEEIEPMSKKTVPFNQTGIGKLPTDKPVVYKIETPGGKNNYTGVAKRGRAQERLQEHLPKGTDPIPGAKVRVERVNTIAEARKKEEAIIAREQPKYNKNHK
ncbi:MAG: helix-turn-helix domain-containing protein [Beijerinckiaceae bacterium]